MASQNNVPMDGGSDAREDENEPMDANNSDVDNTSTSENPNSNVGGSQSETLKDEKIGDCNLTEEDKNIPAATEDNVEVKTSETQREHVMLEKLKELEKGKLTREKELQEELNKLNKKLAEQTELHESEKRRAEEQKNLKELEQQKLTRAQELQEELIQLNKGLEEQIELHESEWRRAEQEQKVKPSSGDSMDMESELQCIICWELFVQATTLGCSHSFCQFCIRQWHSNNEECPICRAPLTSECRSIVLDSLAEKMAATSEEAKAQRQELLNSREGSSENHARVSGNTFPNYDVSSPELRDYYEDNSDSNSSL